MAAPEKVPVPVILLSGFLGTGKTTLLKHWLEHAEGRIGVVVNDVASVNIDAKLIKEQKVSDNAQVNTIQLQNGCACCNLGDELLATISDLVQLSAGGTPFNYIVVELSGVAEPKRIRQNIASAEAAGWSQSAGFALSKTVCVLDASTFGQDYMSFSRLSERLELVDDGETFDAGELEVTQLLAEQVEEADVVILNKTDLCAGANLAVTTAVVGALNSKARLVQTSFGKVAMSTVTSALEDSHGHGHGHDHGHEEAHGHSHAVDCHDANCTDPSHGHNHEAAHSHEASHSHEAHAHSHEAAHSHSHEADCQDANCTDPSHNHGEHGHSHGHDDHGHAHAHDSPAQTTAEERFGIKSFVYTARRPFNAKRFTQLMKSWPVPKKDGLAEFLQADVKGGDRKSPFARIVRSKGFCWMDEYPNTRMYWSHAGKTMILDHDGLWWGTFPQTPPPYLSERELQELLRAKKEDWCEEWRDRRQEVVFIGSKMDEAKIRASLDRCLLTDEELVPYKELQAEAEQKLWQEFEREMQMAEANGP